MNQIIYELLSETHLKDIQSGIHMDEKLLMKVLKQRNRITDLYAVVSPDSNDLCKDLTWNTLIKNSYIILKNGVPHLPNIYFKTFDRNFASDIANIINRVSLNQINFTSLHSEVSEEIYLLNEQLLSILYDGEQIKKWL